LFLPPHFLGSFLAKVCLLMSNITARLKGREAQRASISMIPGDIVNIVLVATAVASAIAAGLSVLYTRSGYRAYTRALIHAQLGVNVQTGGNPDLPKTCFSVCVKTISNSVTATNISVSVYAVRPFRAASLAAVSQARIPFPQVLLKRWSTISVLTPLGEWKGGAPALDERLEHLLSQGMPDLLHQVEEPLVENIRGIAEPVTFYRRRYEFAGPYKIPVRLVVSHDAGRRGARSHMSMMFRLVPIPDKDHPKQLYSWRFDRRIRESWLMRAMRPGGSWEQVDGTSSE
jgi:hypothetical protein